jgi:hypothetical protein
MPRKATCMHKWSIRIALMAVAIVTALAGADRASAAGAVNIDSCQTLSIPNTVYKLTTDLTSCGFCLIVAADRITMDMQGHSITSPCQSLPGITDLEKGFDLITVKNGSISGFSQGVHLVSSTRVSVLGIKVQGGVVGIVTGSHGLVKSSEVSGAGIGIEIDGDRGQVQQSNAHHNSQGIVVQGDKSLVTMNTANFNSGVGIQVRGTKGTVSYNTASRNGTAGITAIVASDHLITRNVALNNGLVDYGISCPSDVTFNESTDGFPTSYNLFGTGCHTANND